MCLTYTKFPVFGNLFKITSRFHNKSSSINTYLAIKQGMKEILGIPIKGYMP